MTDKTYAPERRPTVFRKAALARRLATWLAGGGVSPNAISVVGMAAGCAAGGAWL